MNSFNGHYGKLFPIPINKTNEFAENNIGQITSVNKLARMMGYSRSYFTMRVCEIHEISPGRLLRKIRFQKVKVFIKRYPYETSSSIAKRAGLKDEKALFKFLSYHWDTNFTELRREVLEGEERS